MVRSNVYYRYQTNNRAPKFIIYQITILIKSPKQQKAIMNDFGEMSITGAVLSNTEMQKLRLKRGECVKCGEQCFKKSLFKSTREFYCLFFCHMVFSNEKMTIQLPPFLYSHPLKSLSLYD